MDEERNQHAAMSPVPANAIAEWLSFAEAWVSLSNDRETSNQPLSQMRSMVGAISVNLFNFPSTRDRTSCLATCQPQEGASACRPNLTRTDLSLLSRKKEVQFLSDLTVALPSIPQNRRQEGQGLETAIVVLHRNSDGYDILELTFADRLGASDLSVLEAVAGFLIRTWKPAETASKKRDATDTATADTAVLGPMNPYRLSPSEKRVCTMIGQGMSPADIADTLGLSVETIRTHLKGVFAKTETSSQRELMLMIFKQSALKVAS